jgi:hypothetical protein
MREKKILPESLHLWMANAFMSAFSILGNWLQKEGMVIESFIVFARFHSASSMGQPRRCGPKWSPGYDIGYTFVRNDGYIPPPAIKTLKKLPDEFVEKFNAKTGAYLFYRDRQNGRVGVKSTLEALAHYHRVGAFLSKNGRRVRFVRFL